MTIKYRNHFTSLNDNFFKILSSNLKTRGFSSASIVTNWCQIVGKEYSTKLFPSKIFCDKTSTNSILYVTIKDELLSSTFGFHAPLILSRINTYFGKSNKITKISIDRK